MPMAGDVPNVEVLHHETPSPFTAYGVKGGGEGGRMVAPARDHDGDRGRAGAVRRADRRAADHRRADRGLGGGMRLDHAALMISDPEAARAFYVGVLGLEEIPRPPTFTFPGLWLASGDRQLHLIGEAEPGRARETHPGYRSDELATATRATSRITSTISQASLDGVRARGGEVVGGPRPRGDGVLQAYLADPDGNVVELMQTGVGSRATSPRSACRSSRNARGLCLAMCARPVREARRTGPPVAPSRP